MVIYLQIVLDEDTGKADINYCKVLTNDQEVRRYVEIRCSFVPPSCFCFNNYNNIFYSI